VALAAMGAKWREGGGGGVGGRGQASWHACCLSLPPYLLWLQRLHCTRDTIAPVNMAEGLTGGVGWAQDAGSKNSVCSSETQLSR